MSELSLLHEGINKACGNLVKDRTYHALKQTTGKVILKVKLNSAGLIGNGMKLPFALQ